ncbi:deoxyribodipyrimidine photo-lyase [Alphaproteobacteria bacterium KMM 3653]|uniref:Deoxyribodipyrimidine photo-lyase n=1 Tax=Harenicola maris TaxID=2841044 RepID=A0AAP2CML4_9RHOB|nr:deoxyribodipyrimidine photo-lyase [Harenicola maris]
MSTPGAIILWLRQDLRLSGHPALAAAARTGRPVIPLFIRDGQVDGLGAAAKWRLGQGLESFDRRLQGIGARLILRSGAPEEVLKTLRAETGACDVWWTRRYDPEGIAIDTALKESLKAEGAIGKSFPGHVMFEPWTVETKTGGYYKVYTPFWNAVKLRDVPAPEPAPKALTPPETWPESERLQEWQMGAAMDRGARVLRHYAKVGEEAALTRLGDFAQDWIGDYVKNRDLPAVPGTSGLSENLALGEISPATCWHAGRRAMEEGAAGAETFLKELVWREYAYHLMYHSPRILTANWREEWEAFPWRTDPGAPEVLAWKQGRTGVDFVDAAMRELYTTGTMHNRGRMIVASYLTKHLMTHWRIGMDWFADCLIDWDRASNAMGWQWSAGSGPDATPYFRVFNPDTQLAKFDPKGLYTRRWIAEGQGEPEEEALQFYEAIPRSWGLRPGDARPEPAITLAQGRERALEAYQSRGF